MTASAPNAHPTPTCKGSKYSVAFSRALAHAHLLARRRKVSPTAMGRTSPPSLLSACRDAPARKGAMLLGTRPASRVLRASVRASKAGLWLGALTPSNKCCGRKPDGPPPEPFGKPPRAFNTSSGVWRQLSVSRGGAASGAGARPVGCLLFKARRVSAVPGAAPSEVKAADAGPNRFSSTRASARRLRSSAVFPLLGRLDFFGALSSHKVSLSPASHRPVESCSGVLARQFAVPPTTAGVWAEDASSHLVAASCEGWLPNAIVARWADAKTLVRAVAQRSRQHLGTWRRVGRLVRSTVSAVGWARPASK